MRRNTALPTLGAVLGLLSSVGCSKTQTTTLLTEQWETGQHRSCLFGHKNLYCFPADFLEKLPEGKRKQVTPYFMEIKRDELLQDKRSDGGSYETKYVSHTPVDFSAWDCYKTGIGSPAIVCDLTHKPTAEESAAFVKSEREQEERSRLEQVASNYLMQLKPMDLLAACGPGEQSGGQKTAYSGKFDLRSDTDIKYPFAEFRFEYLGIYGTPPEPSYMLDTANATAPSKFWDLKLQVKYREQALEVVQAIPCLLNQVQLRNNRHLEGDRAADAHGVAIPEL
jgi:hypothetical protein